MVLAVRTASPLLLPTSPQIACVFPLSRSATVYATISHPYAPAPIRRRGMPRYWNAEPWRPATLDSPHVASMDGKASHLRRPGNVLILRLILKAVSACPSKMESISPLRIRSNDSQILGGGCTMAFGRNPAHGVDCTAIPGVMDVACAAGTCIVHRCLPGYVVSLDGSFCIRQNAMTQLDGDINAAVYGLEHVPLKRTNA